MEFKSGKRTRNLFNPGSDKPFKLSRSRLELFVECPRCFYLDRRLGIDRPSMPGWTLNTAVDELLKKEFDTYRALGAPHPIMDRYGVRAVPFQHPKIDIWRHNFTGVQYHDVERNLIIFGAVDDIWIDPEEALIVVDYKATSTQGEITLDAEYRQGYKRQMEIYQWLLRRNGFKVSDTGYFVYANGLKDAGAFNYELRFSLILLDYRGNDGWVDGLVESAYRCLVSDSIPAPSESCEHCAYEWHKQNADRLGGGGV